MEFVPISCQPISKDYSTNLLSLEAQMGISLWSKELKTTQIFFFFASYILEPCPQPKTIQILKIIYLSFQGGASLFLPFLLFGKVDIGIPKNCWENAQIPYSLPLVNPQVRKGLRVPPFSLTRTLLLFFQCPSHPQSLFQYAI
jgi:hypothetical protein